MYTEPACYKIHPKLRALWIRDMVLYSKSEYANLNTVYEAYLQKPADALRYVLTQLLSSGEGRDQFRFL